MTENYLGIDIGGTQLKYALMDQNGQVIEKASCLTPKELESFLAILDEVINQYHHRIQGVAISCPGKVDSQAGIIYFGGALPFLHELNLPKYISDKFHLPAIVINDGKAAALAELWQGQLKGVKHGLAIILGTGVGGGIIVNGDVLQGQHFQAGELSFTALPNSKDPQQMELYGVAGSAVGMIRTIAEELELPDKEDGLKVFEYINQKDPKVYPIFEAYCQKIAHLIYNIQAVLDMEKVVIGGGISAQPILLEEIKRQYMYLYENLAFIKHMIIPVKIEVCAYHNEANLLGALYQFLLQEK